MTAPDDSAPGIGPLGLVLGAVLIIAGSLLLHAYFEASGRSRPWLVKFLPGA